MLRAALEGSRVALARESGVAPLRAGRRLVGTEDIDAGIDIDIGLDIGLAADHPAADAARAAG